jgi:uncharacterized SAM-binding protein YcdF (DUF218 family)
MCVAVVVPGHGASRGERGHRISDRCLRLVAEAERVAARVSADAVVFSGWAAGGGRSEAEQMRDAWRGPHTELVLEPTARNTAENASRTLPLLLERGVGRAVVVCALPHLVRARFLFRGVYGAAGVEARFHALRLVPAPTAVAWELAALPFSPFQLRAARAELRGLR